MRQIRLEGALAFDSLPLTEKAMAPEPPKTRERRIVIASWASADDRAAAAFSEYARWAASEGWDIAVLTGARLVEAHHSALNTQEHPSEHAARLEAVITLAQENYAAL